MKYLLETHKMNAQCDGNISSSVSATKTAERSERFSTEVGIGEGHLKVRFTFDVHRFVQYNLDLYLTVNYKLNFLMCR